MDPIVEIIKLAAVSMGGGGASVLVTIVVLRKLGMIRTSEERQAAAAGNGHGAPASTGTLLASALMARMETNEQATGHRARAYHDLATKLHAEGIEAQKEIQRRYGEDARELAGAIRSLSPVSDNLLHVSNRLAALVGKVDK